MIRLLRDPVERNRRFLALKLLCERLRQCGFSVCTDTNADMVTLIIRKKPEAQPWSEE